MNIGVVVKAKDSMPHLFTALRSIGLVNDESGGYEVNFDLTAYVAYEDGASDDGTEDVVESASQASWIEAVPATPEERPDPAVVHATNDAVEAALDDGVDAIALLDSDNYYIKSSFSILPTALSGGRADVVYGDNVKLEPHDGDWMVAGFSNSPAGVSAGKLVRQMNVVPGNSILARAEVWEDVKWDAEMVGGWDVDWYVRVLANGYSMRKARDGHTPVVATRFREDSMFHQSIEGYDDPGEESRWEEWRRDLRDKLPDLKQRAIESHFGNVTGEDE